MHDESPKKSSLLFIFVLVFFSKFSIDSAMETDRLVGDFILGRQIGSGSFSVVWVARHRFQGTEVAVKEIAMERLGTKLRERLMSEIVILKNISHPNIISLQDIIEAHGQIYLVLEYCRGGDLSTYIRRHGKVPESTAKHFMQQLASGLQVLRENNLIHRDLKPQNLLLTTHSDNSILKIADFGFARSLQPQGLAETLCGSPLYMAPEIMQLQKYDAKADLWSVGAILYQLVTGKTPFTGTNQIQLLQNIIKSNELHFPPDNNLSCDCIDLCRKLLRPNPVERLTFQELFNHQFLSQHTPNESLRQTLSGMRDASPLIESSNARPSGESSQVKSLPFHLDEKSGGQDGKLSALKSSGSIMYARGIDNKVDKIPIGSPSRDAGVLSRCTNSQKQQEKTSCSQISLGRNVKEATASLKDSGADSWEIVDQDYVLVRGPSSSSSVNNASGPRNSFEKLDCSPVEPQKSSYVCSSAPIPGRATSNPRAIGCLEDRSSPACGNSQRSVDTRDNIEQPSAHCMTRIRSLKRCASLINELVRKEIAEGRQLEAFSVQLLILAIWKQAWQICESQTASATEGIPSHEVRAREGTISVPSTRECYSSVDSPLSEAFCSQINRDFIAQIDYANELSKELAELEQFDENWDMPDAIEMIFQFALALGRNGAVCETMENMERAASQYSKSICLLHFLLVEASSLDCKPRFFLPGTNRRRLHAYLDKLSSRHDCCRSSRSAPSQE